VFLSTLQLTALLLKSFRLRLHCYTLAFYKYDVTDLYVRHVRAPAPESARLDCVMCGVT